MNTNTSPTTSPSQQSAPVKAPLWRPRGAGDDAPTDGAAFVIDDTSSDDTGDTGSEDGDQASGPEFEGHVDVEREPDLRDETQPGSGGDDAGGFDLVEGATRWEVRQAQQEQERARFADVEQLLETPERLGELAPPAAGWRQWCRRVGVKVGPSPAEISTRRDLAAARGQWSRAMTVVIANGKGGTAKTATTVGLAGGFGQARGGGVIAWDNNELRGSLGLRTASVGSTRTVEHLLRRLGDLEEPGVRMGDVLWFLRHQPDGLFDVLASHDGVAMDEASQISADDFNRVHDLLARFCSVLVVDTGNNEVAANWMAAMRRADQLVVPVQWDQPSVMHAMKMLARLEHMGLTALTTSAVVVATHGPQAESAGVRAEYHDFFQERCAAVLEVPTDPHIHAKGVLEHNALTGQTRRAYLALAAHVGANFSHVDHHGTNHAEGETA